MQEEHDAFMEWAALIQGEVTMGVEDGILELVAGDSLIFELPFRLLPMLPIGHKLRLP